MGYGVFIPSGAGAPGFAGIVACLREEMGIRIYSGDISPRAYGKSLSDGFAKMPPSSSTDYVKAVLKKAKEFDCSVVLPITTGELNALSNAAETMRKKGISMAITPPHGLEIANNKAALYKYLHQMLMPHPQSIVVNNKKKFFAALKKLRHPHVPIAMKPAEGNGSRGFRIVVTAEELKHEYFDTKAGTLKTTYEALQAELPDVFPYDMLVMEYLPGAEFSVDMLVDRGKTIISLMRLREKTVSGISVRGTFESDADIEHQCRIIAKNLDLHGPIGMQFKIDLLGMPKLLEINPRLQGAVSTARFVGVNFPLLAVKMARGESIKPFSPKIRPAVSFNRYWEDIQE